MRASKTANRLAALIDWTDPLRPGNGACLKVQYQSRADAERHLRRLPPRGDQPLNTYRCHLCRAWHVGNAGERIR